MPEPDPSASAQGLAPVWRPDARVLLLGSFPGQASLAAGQYYAHPRNAFWPAVAALLTEPELPGLDYADRLVRLQARGIALWDAVERCVRPGSLDSDIRAAEPSDLSGLVARLPVLRAIGCNGAAALTQVRRSLPAGPWPVLGLPSTSPAHAQLTLAAKCQRWRDVLAPYL